MNISDIKIPKQQRGVIIGQSRTGKSHLAKFLLPQSGPLGIIDPKRTFDYDDPSCKVYRTVDAIKFWKPERFVYRPNPDNLNNISDYNEVFKYMYKRGKGFAYVDDMVGIMEKNTYPHYLQVCYQMGGEQDLRCLSAFQFPCFVPRFLMTEVMYFYLFYLHYPPDVLKIKSMVPGYDPERLNNRHDFLFYDCKLTRAKLMVAPAKLPTIRRAE